jgi:ATP:ADP antiporter, AAA family
MVEGAAERDAAPAATWPCRISGAQPGELPAAVWAFVYFFALLAAYYVLRPIRDEMAIQVGQAGQA